jgi:tetratricopeptide (TPR) repeat protein
MTETIHDPAEVLRQGSQDILSVDRGQDSWPFDWSDIDIPGSPGLSRLFKGLEVECAHIPTLTLHEPESGDTSCLSASEIQEVLHKKNDATDTPDTPDKSSHQYLSSLIQRHCSSLGRPSRSRQPQYPWRDIKNVYCGYATDPLREIYVFSNSNPENLPRQLSNPRVPVWTDIQVAERELRSKFTHLRMQLPEDSPAVVAVMDNLAFILYEMEDYRQAEVLYRKLVDIYKRTLKGPDIKFLEACQRVIESLRCQGQYSTAKDWNDEIRPTISRLFEPHDALAVRAARNDARLAEDLGSSEESEKLLRELLQITLVVHGPRHQSTIAAISSLGSTMSHRGKEEGHTLLRTAVQLSLERQDELAEIGCWATGELTLILKESDMFEEGYNVATKAVAQFGPLLGQNNRHITTLEQYRAWTMPRIGNMPEREKVFRGLISAYSNSRVESNQDLLMDTWDCLAGVLSQTHRMEEAIYWYEQSFEMRFPQDGANNSRVVDVCYRLANCYERQGRLENALDVYSRMIGKIYDCCKEQYDMIPVFGFEISRIEELVEQWTRCS